MQLPRAPYKAGSYEAQREEQNTAPSHGFVIREITHNVIETRGRYEAVVMAN